MMAPNRRYELSTEFGTPSWLSVSLLYWGGSYIYSPRLHSAAA